ncbi:MAG: class I SAM-dependent methyltransferase [Thaumarchaeota archaeon]|nr:class I SAM-dependent methyltransferase [Nitrososphaerota archaeon]
MSTWDDAYKGIPPPWDTGKPQDEFVMAGERGEVLGKVIDVGCGTGEHAIHFAKLGHAALGVDWSPTAIQKAVNKAQERGSDAEFLVWDALRLGSLGRKFDTALDSGLFHTFPDTERAAYVWSLGEAVRPGGGLLVLCFSENERADWGGPRRVTQQEIRDSFSEGWRVEYVRRARFQTRFHKDWGEAWLSRMIRSPEGSLR